MSYWIAEDGSAIDFDPHESSGWRRVTRKEYDAARKASAIKELRKLLRPGDSIYSICTHRSSSGMSHRFRSFVPIRAGKGRLALCDISHLIHRATGITLRDGELVMGGCGYSKSFEIAYATGWVLWPKGTRKPHGVRNGQPDRDGGYALQDGRL